VGRREEEVAIGADHGAPLGRWRLCAEAEEAERRHVEDRAADAERPLHDDGRERVRQHLAEEDGRLRSAERSARRDELTVAQAQDRRAHHTRVDGDRDHADRELGVDQPGADDGHDGDRQQEAREGEQHIHDAHQEVVHPSAHVARDRADERTEHDRESDREESHLQAESRPVEHARKHVAHVVVEAEDVLRPFAAEELDARSGEPNRAWLLVDEHLDRTVARKEVGAECRDHENAEQREADSRRALLQEGTQRASERRLRAGGGSHAAHELILTRGSR